MATSTPDSTHSVRSKATRKPWCRRGGEEQRARARRRRARRRAAGSRSARPTPSRPRRRRRRPGRCRTAARAPCPSRRRRAAPAARAPRSSARRRPSRRPTASTSTPASISATPACSVRRPNRGAEHRRAGARADRGAQRPRDQARARVDRAVVQPDLQAEREREDHARSSRRRTRARSTRPPENARLRNRLGVTSGETPVRSRRRASAAKAPSTTKLAAIEANVHARPAELAALDQRVDQQPGAEADQRGAGEVERRAAARPATRGAGGRRADQGREAERHVDEEDRAPAGAEEVEVDQRAAEHRAEHRAQADHGAEQPERLADLVGREDLRG